MILLANTMSSTRNTLAVIFFLTCRPNLISIALFIFRTAVYRRLHTIIERKNIKTLIAWFRLHVRAQICSTDLKLFSMRQRFLYSSGTSFMVRFVPAFHICGIHQVLPSSLALLFLETLFYHQPKPECCSVAGSHLVS